MPRVSIVLLSWNQSAFVPACLESIARQSFVDFEVVAIDNGSSDGSADLIERQSEKLGLPLTLVRNAANEGIPKALNRALESVSGEFVVPFAADDIMLRHRLEEQVDQFDQCGLEYLAVSGDVALIDPQGKPLTYSPAVWLDPSGDLSLVDEVGNSVREGTDVFGVMRTPWLLDEERQFENVLAGNSPLTATAMFRASAYSSIGHYDESIAIEDYDYWLRIAQQSRICYRPGVVVLYRRQPKRADLGFRTRIAGAHRFRIIEC
jgi:glycosyltransferase involved in cell wall biosynthesis